MNDVDQSSTNKDLKDIYVNHCHPHWLLIIVSTSANNDNEWHHNFWVICATVLSSLSFLASHSPVSDCNLMPFHSMSKSHQRVDKIKPVTRWMTARESRRRIMAHHIIAYCILLAIGINPIVTKHEWDASPFFLSIITQTCSRRTPFAIESSSSKLLSRHSSLNFTPTHLSPNFSAGGEGD